jgi:hypothetical protein
MAGARSRRNGDDSDARRHDDPEATAPAPPSTFVFRADTNRPLELMFKQGWSPTRTIVVNEEAKEARYVNVDSSSEQELMKCMISMLLQKDCHIGC